MENKKVKGRRYIPTEYLLNTEVLPKQQFKVVRSETTDEIKLYITPMFQTALNENRRGRTSMELEANKSTMARMLSERVNGQVRGLIKKHSFRQVMFGEVKMICVDRKIVEKDNQLFISVKE